MSIAMLAPAAALAPSLAFAGLAPANDQQQPAPPEAAPETVDPARLAAARDLLVATNTHARFAAIIPLMFRQVRQSLPGQGRTITTKSTRSSRRFKSSF